MNAFAFLYHARLYESLKDAKEDEVVHLNNEIEQLRSRIEELENQPPQPESSVKQGKWKCVDSNAQAPIPPPPMDEDEEMEDDDSVEIITEGQERPNFTPVSRVPA